jgi:hypothetical protein
MGIYYLGMRLRLLMNITNNRFVYSYSNNWIVYLFQWKVQDPMEVLRPSKATFAGTIF